MENDETNSIEVEVDTKYIAEQSAPAKRRFVFAYTITIHNTGSIGARPLFKQN